MNFLNSLRTFILALLLSIGVSYAYAAWAPPTSPPTGGNTDAPVNVGSAPQLKAGALGVNDLFRAYSNAIFDGNVGIGASSMASWEKLKVNGPISLSAADPDGYSALITSESSGLPLRLKSRAGNAPDFIVATNGNVGIGTASPGAKLDVNGGVKVTTVSSSCAPSLAGTIMYDSDGKFKGCNGLAWVELNGSGGTPPSGTQTFISDGAFTIPSGVSTITVEVWGAGGGGGTGGGGGGGSGGYAKSVLSVSSGSTHIVTVGIGGNGGNCDSFTSSSGGTSSFGPFLSATGGGGGSGVFSGFAGGPGGSGVNGNITNSSGITGSSADSIAYIGGKGGDGVLGALGGAGGGTSVGAAGAGSPVGGGGGGDYRICIFPGGNGARGQVIVSW